mgnify:CR=1 FL=1
MDKKTASNVKTVLNYAPPESRTQILRTGILRAIHYTKGTMNTTFIVTEENQNAKS